jgi:hypothetical protein
MVRLRHGRNKNVRLTSIDETLTLGTALLNPRSTFQAEDVLGPRLFVVRRVWTKILDHELWSFFVFFNDRGTKEVIICHSLINLSFLGFWNFRRGSNGRFCPDTLVSLDAYILE